MSVLRSGPRTARMSPGRMPARVVALGGGTGLPVVLRGFRSRVGEGGLQDLTAIVTMSDDGGSSGRLRRSMGVPPPGDVRNCLVALSEDEDLLAGLFQHRYDSGHELDGHSVGNLILAALAERTGCFLKAIEASSRVLRTVGRILPSTLEDVTLTARLADGRSISGETNIGAASIEILGLKLIPEDAVAGPGVLDVLGDSDLIVIGPGSLYTSVLPNLLVPGVARAIFDSKAAVVMVGNLVSEHGEAAGLTLADHIEVVERHVGYPLIDAVLVNTAPADARTLRNYQAEGATPLHWPRGAATRVHVEGRPLLERGIAKLRHDPLATASGVLEAWRTVVTTCRTVGKA